MSNIKFFFTFILFFAIGTAAQAQVTDTTPAQEETAVVVKKNEIQPNQIEEGLSIEINVSNNINATPNSTTSATPAGTKITTDSEAYVFYFNHKQFLKPLVRKSALC